MPPSPNSASSKNGNAQTTCWPPYCPDASGQRDALQASDALECSLANTAHSNTGFD